MCSPSGFDVLNDAIITSNGPRSPLGSPDLASAWFALAPSLHDPQP